MEQIMETEATQDPSQTPEALAEAALVPQGPFVWLDRWTEPTVEQLMEGLKVHQQRNFGRIMEFLNEHADLQWTLLWYGSSWKWTIHYTFKDGSRAKDAGGDGEKRTMCYLILNYESPVISIPLSDELIARLPLRRLSKFLREGIKNAKCAVDYHWAAWTPGLENETGMIVDLLNRKYKFMKK
jgi:hypothetical protein